MQMESSPENRRQQVRVPFASDCAVEPRSPAWTMLPQPLAGETINLTENGVRLVIPGFETDRYEKWHRHLDKGDTIRVSVTLQGDAQPLKVEGEIVWLGFTPADDDPNARNGDCTVGVLLSLLDDSARTQLRALISR